MYLLNGFKVGLGFFVPFININNNQYKESQSPVI